MQFQNGRFGFEAQPPHDLEVGEKIVEHLPVHQRVIVIAEKGLVDGIDQHADVRVVVLRAHGLAGGAVRKKIHIGPLAGHGFVQHGGNLAQSRHQRDVRFVAEEEAESSGMRADLGFQGGGVFAQDVIGRKIRPV